MPGGWQTGGADPQPPFAALADAVTRAMYWQDPEDFDVAGLPADAATAIRQAADELATHPDTAWWDAPFAPDDQHVVAFVLDGRGPAPPALTGLRAGIHRAAEHHERTSELRDPAGHVIDWRTVSGTWWSAPLARDVIRTTRAVGPDRQPVGLACVEDELGWQQAGSWPVEPVGAPRVAELAAPADWVRLCHAYPLDVTDAKRGDWWRATGRDGRWVVPDWRAVAGDWDAVHLTVTGYLTTAGRALEVDGEHASVLAGWDPDATFWFADSLRFAGPGEHWQRAQDAEWRRLPDS